MGVVEAIRRIAPTNIQKCRGCIIIRPQLLLTDGAKVNGAILTLTEFKTLSGLNLFASRVTAQVVRFMVHG